MKNGISVMPHPRLSSVVAADGAQIVDERKNVVITLNATGALIWKYLQAGQSLTEIVEHVAHETNTDPVTVEQDLDAFLADLKANHLMA